MKLDTTNLEALKRAAGPVADYDGDRILNITDPKWAHPEVSFAWYDDQTESPIIKILDPKTSPEERVVLGQMTQGAIDAFDAKALEAYAERFDIEVVEAPGCPEEPDTPVKLYVLRSKGMDRSKPCPVLLWVSGGALVECFATFCPYDDIDADNGCAFVVPRYRLIWEAGYPAPINDIHAAYQWIVENADEQRFDADNVVISGTSSGGHLSLAAGFRLKRYGYKPRGIVPVFPQTGMSYGDGRRAIFNACWDTFQQNHAMELWVGNSHTDFAVGPEAFPNTATVEDCAGYPPTFIAQGELDPDSTGTLRFVQTLHEADAYCELHFWGGSSHVGSVLVASTHDEMRTCVPSEYSELVYHVTRKNIRDAFAYDLRRPWIAE